MRDLRRTVIGQLSKNRLTSGAFFLTVELFSTFFYTWCGKKKHRERCLKKRWGRFPKALCYIGIQCKKSAGRKEKKRQVWTRPKAAIVFVGLPVNELVDDDYVSRLYFPPWESHRPWWPAGECSPPPSEPRCWPDSWRQRAWWCAVSRA